MSRGNRESVQGTTATAVEGATFDATIPRFIVGMSRGGTTWMTQSLNEHPQLAVFGESGFWSRRYIEPRPDGLYGPEQLAALSDLMKGVRFDSTVGAEGPGWMQNIRTDDIPALVDSAIAGLSPPVRPGAAFVALAQEFARAEGKVGWAEKTPNHLVWLDRILAELPDARFVVMVREPYSFMLSYKHQADRGSEQRRERYRRRYHPLGCTVVWKKTMAQAMRAAGKYPGQVMIVELGDVRSRPQGVMKEVQEFLGIEVTQDLTGIAGRSNSSFDQRERPKLPAAGEMRWLNLLAAQEIREAGFELRRPEGGRLVFFGSVLSLPIWAFHLLADVRRKAQSPLRYLWRWVTS